MQLLVSAVFLDVYHGIVAHTSSTFRTDHGDKNGINLFTIPQVFPEGKALSGYTLSTINRLILEDSERNRRTNR